jgi:sulfonate transport system permease protein
VTTRTVSWAWTRSRTRKIPVSRAAVSRLLLRALLIAVLLACWQAVGGHQWFARGAVPSPHQVWDSLRADWGDYGLHVQATLWTGLWGFLIGNAIGCVFAFLYLLWPTTAPVTRGLLITLFCMPIAIIAPLLGVMLPLESAKVVIASMWSIFNMQVALLLAMQQVPPGALAVVKSAGGGRLRQLLLVHARAGLPGFLAALQINAPSTLLAAIFGDFIGGQKGIGIYLTGLIVSGNQSRIWAFSLVIAAIGAALYIGFGLLRSLVTGSDINIAVAETVASAAAASRGARGRQFARSLASAVCGLALVLAAWWGFVSSVSLPSVIANTPLDVLHTFTGPRGSQVIDEIGAALGSSGPLALSGVVLGLLAALALAVAATLAPWFTQLVMPFAMVFQSVPTVAFAPLLAIAFGRGALTIVLITILVTFFPAFVAISTGLASAPAVPGMVLKSVAASRLTMLRLYVVPQAMPYLLAAARLVIPLAILGVVLAEQLITGTGLGNLMSQAVGYQDFPMMWCITVVMIAISVVSYLAVETFEHWYLARRQQ